jgi:signal transduction histidine kinase
MAGPSTQRIPTFFWQGLLILLPVAVLVVIGVISLRQDKILAQHDAAERAQVIADDLAAKIWNELIANSPDQFRPRAFQVDENGRIIFPPPYSPVPTPQPFNLAELNAEQARLWATLQAADAGTQKPEVLDQAFKKFIDSNPPENFAAAASYGQGLRLVQQGKLLEAAEAFGLVTEKYATATGESGLPLWPLAQFKLFEILPHPHGSTRYFISYSRSDVQRNDIDSVLLSYSLKHFVSLDALCSNIVYHPTPLSPHLLTCIQEDLSLPDELLWTYQAEKLREQREDEGWNRLRARLPGSESNVIQRPRVRFPRSEVQLIENGEVGKWQRLWQDYETARQLYAAARGHFYARANPAPPSFPLLSTSANDGNQTAGDETLRLKPGGTVATISFPRLFWFTTPNLLYVPKAPGRGTEVTQNIFQGYVVAETHAVGSNSSSNAAPAVTRWIVGGTLDRDWLAIGFDDHETNHWFVCHSESDLGHRITELATGEKHIPDYFGIGVEVAGRKIRAFAPDLHMWTFSYRSGGKAGGGEVRGQLDALATNVLASAVRPEQLLKVNVYLTSPDKLYQRQAARTFWFGSLVAVSAAAALIGLLTAWRAFLQQRQLSELKSNFVSSVSHELRAPIASVRLMAENLEGGKIPEPQKQKEYFGFIVQECRRLTSLIENVLDFSRIEQGRKQYEFEPTDVVALLRQTVALMQPNAAEKQVQLLLKLDDSQLATLNSQPIEMDGRAIQQALVNLMDNAIKHSPKGETVTVGIEMQNQKFKIGDDATTLNPQPSTLNLSVSDHGPGIPPAEHEKIFERFYRRGSELRRETQGVGIGLSIVKHIIEAHGGRVLVESAVGQGSRFVIELPIRT